LARTHRSKLQEEGASSQKLRDELRLQVAIKCLRDTDMTVEEASEVCGEFPSNPRALDEHVAAAI
jgi:transcriptional regulator GlxA family with amidase domain